MHLEKASKSEPWYSMADSISKMLSIEETTLSSDPPPHLSQINHIHHLDDPSSATFLLHFPSIPRKKITSVPIEYHYFTLLETVYLGLGLQLAGCGPYRSPRLTLLR
jgi:hypothetical protein